MSEPAPPFSFQQFNTLINGIERLSDYGRRISDSIAGQPCEYLIQEATMAFVKTMMSVQAFLRFIPSSRFHGKEVEFAIDLSSASVMARQVLEDSISFFYLSERNLTPEEKTFVSLSGDFTEQRKRSNQRFILMYLVQNSLRLPLSVIVLGNV